MTNLTHMPLILGLEYCSVLPSPSKSTPNTTIMMMFVAVMEFVIFGHGERVRKAPKDKFKIRN